MHIIVLLQGCNRSFAELWRLKVHFRAPPDVRGSGKERGHGTELKFCPKCGKELKPGKHHVGCSAGTSAPRQAAKRQRQMSSTTESDWVSPSSTASLGDAQSDSWEDTVRRQVNKVHRQRSYEEVEMGSGAPMRGGTGITGAPSGRGSASTAAGGRDAACRVQRMQEMLTEGDNNAELVFTANTMADFGLVLRHGNVAGSAQHEAGMDGTVSPSPSLAQILDAADHAADLASMPIMRVPSPPPLPPDWDTGFAQGGHNALLFDFDQFDANRRTTIGGAEPIMTVTSAMNPAEMSNPSDDYIWQIMFAGENEVPKRVTAHLHHPADPTMSEELARLLDEPDILDGIEWADPGKASTAGHHNIAIGPGGGGYAAPPPPYMNGMHAPQPVPSVAAVLEAGGGHFGGGGFMHPPPARHVSAADFPPLPPEALQVAGQTQQAQTITVTYVVQPGGPSGQPQYAVKSVAAGGGSELAAPAAAPSLMAPPAETGIGAGMMPPR